MKKHPFEGMTQKDVLEIGLFRTFLRLKEKYGIKALARRKFWREYMGL